LEKKIKENIKFKIFIFSPNEKKMMEEAHNTINFDNNRHNSNKDFDPLMNKLNSLYGKSNKIIPSSIGTVESPKNNYTK